MNIKPICLLSFILILTISLFAQVDPGTQNLTHSWTFEDGTANDYVGGVNGYLMGGAVIEDGALVTAELDQYMELLAEDVALQTYTEFTVDILFQSFEGLNANYHMFFYFGDTQKDMGNNGFFMTPARGDNVSKTAITCWVETAYQGEDGANGPECEDGLLHHMAATLSNEEIALFIDGVETGRTPLQSRNTIDALFPIHCYLAKSGYNGDATWRGKIFECNIYNRILNADEILFIAQKGGITAVDEMGPIANLPEGYGLLQNFPNPFNPNTTIFFNLQKRSWINITVYDMLGHQVAELLNEVKDAGQFSVQFDGSNLSSGLYLCKMQNDGHQIFTKKMMLLK
ncbi:T9SS type A sorting domain-containing protein [bacterium]|nr:T9SS type A sorting domain-containing protein [bacterium]